MRILLLLTVVTWHVTSSNAMAVDPTEASEAVSSSLNSFSTKFFKSVGQDVTGNLICSPISASMVLSMATFGARGETEKQLRSVLSLPNEDTKTKSGFQNLIDSFANINQVDLRLANKIFLGNGFEPKPEFRAVTETSFRSEAQSVDFSKAVEASKTINDWCEAQTNNRIKDLIKPEYLDAATVMVLVNAVYFKGNWAVQFSPEETKPRPFHANGDVAVKDVPTMHRLGQYRYGELPEVKAKFVELPYKSKDISDAVSMFIILPDEINGLSELEKNIEKISLQQLFSGYSREVDLYLPKFKIESEIDLQESLSRLGLTDMFSNAANFTGIVDSPPLKVGKIVQKAFIEVNEEGSEAAAATGLGVSSFSMPLTYEFRADHPFYYAIIKRSEPQNGGITIFYGRCSDFK